MTEHQTKATLTYRETIKARNGLTFRRNMGKALTLDRDYADAYNTAMAGGDRFVFTKATRRYLKALRQLAREDANR